MLNWLMQDSFLSTSITNYKTSQSFQCKGGGGAGTLNETNSRSKDGKGELYLKQEEPISGMTPFGSSCPQLVACCNLSTWSPTVYCTLFSWIICQECLATRVLPSLRDAQDARIPHLTEAKRWNPNLQRRYSTSLYNCLLTSVPQSSKCLILKEAGTEFKE